jgi:hypothetical protein
MKLYWHYQKNVHHIEFDEVMRQEENSGILYNATAIDGNFTRTFY